MRRPDGATSRVVLIGTANYSSDASLPDLPAVLNNLTDIVSELNRPAHGWFAPQSCEVIRDPGTASDLGRRLNRLAPQAEDLLLVYYAGHGLLDSRGNLYLGLTGTQRDLLRYTAMPYDGVKEAIMDSPARNRVVILDCCFSGRAIDVMAPDSVVTEQTQITGSFTLTATASGVTALAPRGERNTAFTGELLRLLREGDPRAPEQLTLDHVYRSLYRGLKSRGLPEPRRQGTDTVEDLVVARNMGYSQLSGGDHRDAVDGEGRLVVEDAERLGHGGDPGAAARRYTEITKLLLPVYGADSPNVRSAQASRDFWARQVTRISTPTWRSPTRTAATPTCICLDFGVSNSVVSVLEDGEPTVIFNAEGARSTPSVVAFAKNGEVLVGEEARRQAVVNAERTIRSVKRHIGTDWTIRLDGKDFTPQQVSAFILQKLKRDAETCLESAVSEAVITVPAHFDEAQRRATREAAELAGLDVLRIVNEPTAAALAYGLDRSDQTVLVFDLGGGTYDVSLLKIGDGVVEVKATSGDSRLGGDDWDQRIVDYLVKRFRSGHGIDLSQDKTALQRVREAAERAKIDLSSTSETTISLPYIAASAEGPLHLEEKLTRARFQQLTAGLLERCEAPLHNVLRDAGADITGIDRVILVGGSTRMPAVAELVRELTGGREIVRSVNPDEAVADGAALQAGVIKGKIDDVLILDVTPYSLGIETKGGIMTKIIERNTTIPTKRSEIFTTAEDNQPAIQIQLYQGEHELVAYNKRLGMIELTGLPPAPRGDPQIEITFEIDADNLIHMSAKDLSTGEAPQMVYSH
jgi:molecular chaperone DnaK